MTFTFAQPLKLLAIGGSLITSTSLWFFKPHVPLPFQAQNRSSTDSSPRVSVPDKNPNINLLPPAPKLASYSPKPSKFDAQITDPEVNKDAKEITFTVSGSSKQKNLKYTNLEEIKDFKIENILGYRSQYEEIDKESIKIHLFKQPAWFSPTDRDEFESTPLTTTQIEELFTGVDETKTKQLLLSLRKWREWYKFWEPDTFIQYIALIPYHQITRDPSELTNLKIKYFDDFSSLKTYVHKKVKESCKDDDKACIADPEELTFLKADSLKYFPK